VRISSADRCLAVALAVLASGCVSGHLVAAGRRREYARDLHAVTTTAQGTVVRYTAEVTDDDGHRLDTVERTVRLPPGHGDVAVQDLTRTWTAPVVYPLLPPAIGADVVVFPVLTLLAPIVLIFGD
jgi:hypothetical protein